MPRSSRSAHASRFARGAMPAGRRAYQVPDGRRAGSARPRGGRDQAFAGAIELHQPPGAADIAKVGGDAVLDTRLPDAAKIFKRPAEMMTRAAALRLEGNGAQEIGYRALVILEIHVDRGARELAVGTCGIALHAALDRRHRLARLARQEIFATKEVKGARAAGNRRLGQLLRRVLPERDAAGEGREAIASPRPKPRSARTHQHRNDPPRELPHRRGKPARSAEHHN